MLGQTGNWDGDDVVRIVLEQPAAARVPGPQALPRTSSARREPPSDDLLEPLAAQFRESDYDIADLVRTMLRSRLFFSAHAYRQRIKSPVEYVVGMLRGLERRRSLPARSCAAASLRLLDAWARRSSPRRTSRAGPAARPGSTRPHSWPAITWPGRSSRGTRGPSGSTSNPAGPGPQVRARATTPRRRSTSCSTCCSSRRRARSTRRAPGAGRRSWSEASRGAAPRDRRVRETTHAILLMPEYQLA